MKKTRRAQPQPSALKALLHGPAGSGKTYSSLALAHHLLGELEIPVTDDRGECSIFLVDSEFQRGLQYGQEPCGCGCSDLVFTYGHGSLEDDRPEDYVEALKECQREGRLVVILDSLTHAWERLRRDNDRLANTKFRGNSWAAWSSSKPRWYSLIHEIMRYPGMVICTSRAKTSYGDHKEGQKIPAKIGLEPTVAPEADYEFDLVLQLAHGDAGTGDVLAYVEKDVRSGGHLTGSTWRNPGLQAAQTLARTLSGQSLRQIPHEVPQREAAPRHSYPVPDAPQQQAGGENGESAEVTRESAEIARAHLKEALRGAPPVMVDVVNQRLAKDGGWDDPIRIRTAAGWVQERLTSYAQDPEAQVDL